MSERFLCTSKDLELKTPTYRLKKGIEVPLYTEKYEVKTKLLEPLIRADCFKVIEKEYVEEHSAWITIFLMSGPYAGKTLYIITGQHSYIFQDQRRYQEVNWFNRRLRDLWFLTLPFEFLWSWLYHFEHTKKEERESPKIIWNICRGMIDSKRNYWYSSWECLGSDDLGLSEDDLP